MNAYNRMKYLAACLLISLTLPETAAAQIVVADIASAKNSIKTWMEDIKESKFVVSTTQAVSKTSAAIGEAKKTVSEYVIENKKKMEKRLKQVKEYREKVEEYKKEYEEYRKQYEEYKRDYEETRAQVEEGIETAKQAKTVAQGTMESAKNTVGSAAAKVQEQAGAAVEKAGISIPSGQTLPQAPSVQKPLRKSFGSSSPQASANDIRSFAVVSQVEKVAFAFALELPDSGTDVNNNFIIPQSIAMYPGCELNSKTARDKGKLDACLRLINQNAQKPRVEDITDAPIIRERGQAEYAAAVIAEAYRAKNDAEAFEEKVLDPIEDAPAPQVLDIYANIVEVNKATTTALNSLLRLQSARLALQAYTNYGEYEFLPEER